MELSFSKYQGAGNHFIFIQDFEATFPVEEKPVIRRMCDVRFGIGADGLILLRRSRVCDFQMRIFNRDGFEAKSCGNGLRCLIRFLHDFKLFSGRVSIEALGGNVLGFLEGPLVGIELSYRPKKPQKRFFFQKTPVYFVDTGVPHAVLSVSAIEDIPFLSWGRKLRNHPLFGKEGANINFIEKNEDSYRVRTYERGVEEETFACGTGAVAVALVQQAFLEKKREVKLIFKGGVLDIELRDNIVMKGPADFVFSGEYRIGIPSVSDKI